MLAGHVKRPIIPGASRKRMPEIIGKRTMSLDFRPQISRKVEELIASPISQMILPKQSDSKSFNRWKDLVFGGSSRRNPRHIRAIRIVFCFCPTSPNHPILPCHPERRRVQRAFFSVGNRSRRILRLVVLLGVIRVTSAQSASCFVFGPTSPDHPITKSPDSSLSS